MTTVIDVRNTEDRRDVVHRAVQALAEGGLVVFPTETVYGVAAAARHAGAVERLCRLKERQGEHPFTLAVRGEDDALDYVPDLCPLARRLARRCWPGPITLVVAKSSGESLVGQLPEIVRQVVLPGDTLGLRVPAHDLILETLHLTAGPLVLTSANRAGMPPAVRGGDIGDSLGDDVTLVLDDGPCRFGQPSAVVRIVGNRMEVLRHGVVSQTNLQRLASLMILLVCTGNTCRSPMAEVLCRKQIAQRFGCRIDEVEDRGVLVVSAGIAAMAGGGPTPEAVSVMCDRGLDLSQHETQPLTERLVRHADEIWTMTQSHRHAIVAQWPSAARRTKLLAGENTDVSDPIGASRELYARCAEQIDAALKRRLDEIDWKTVLPADS